MSSNVHMLAVTYEHTSVYVLIFRHIRHMHIHTMIMTMVVVMIMIMTSNNKKHGKLDVPQ